MKSIKRLLDRLHQLIGKLHEAVTKLEEKTEGRQNAKLYDLRFDRFLKELGITNRFQAETIYKNAASNDKVSKYTALRNAAKTIGEQNGKTIAERNRALAVAMTVKLPTLAEKAKGKVRSVSNGTRKIREKIVEKTNGKGPLIRNVLLVVIGLLLLWGLISLFSSKRTETENRQTQNNQSQQNAPTDKCAGSWEMQHLNPNPEENKWVDKGVVAIATAFDSKNPEDAKKAFEAWLYGDPDHGQPYGIRSYKNELIPAAQMFLDENQWPDPNQISDEGQCANEATVQLVEKIRIAVLGQGKVTAENAPINGINTGIENGKVVSYPRGDVNGDIRSIRVETKVKIKGDKRVKVKVRWIMFKCGNVVTEEIVVKVFGESPKHHHDHEKPKCKGNECLTPKNPAADPAPRGNAPKGGGKNQDPGPGKYQAPNEVTKPSSQPRVNPDPPKTSSSGSSSSSDVPKGSTPDPTPPPAPEKAAPTPSKPATGTVKIPGM